MIPLQHLFSFYKYLMTEMEFLPLAENNVMLNLELYSLGKDRKRC